MNLSHQKSENTIIAIYPGTVVDDGWSIQSTFLEQTVQQLEFVWEVVLSEVS